MPRAHQESGGEKKREESIGEQRMADGPENRKAYCQGRERGDTSSYLSAHEQAGRRAADPAGRDDEEKEIETDAQGPGQRRAGEPERGDQEPGEGNVEWDFQKVKLGRQVRAA